MHSGQQTGVNQITLKIDNEIHIWENAPPEFKSIFTYIIEYVSVLHDKPTDILDIGSGLGFLVKNTINVFPESNFTLLDIDQRRLHKAKNKIKPITLANINLINTDVRDAIFPKSSFDIIQSAFALNFLNDKDDFEHIMGNCINWLNTNGILIIGDYFNNKNKIINQKNIELFYFSIEKCRSLNYCNFAELFKSIHKLFNSKYYVNVSLLDQIEILRYIGFREVDILYKKSCFAVIYAKK